MNSINKDISDKWHSVRIGEIAKVISGGTPDTNNDLYWGEEYNWITPTEITKTGKYIARGTKKKITELGLKNSSAVLIPKGSLVLCSRATIGECAINLYSIATNQGFKNLLPGKDINVEFLYYRIKTLKRELLKISSGSTFLEFSKKDIEKIKFDLPPLCEQNRIVRVLGTWDGAIEKLSRKIELKKRIKRGLMRKLLTGEVHSDNRYDERRITYIGKICEVKRGGSPRPIQNYLTKEENGLNWLRIGDVNVDSKYIYNTKEKIKLEGLNKTALVNDGDFILSNSMSFGRPYIMRTNACIHDGWLTLKNISSNVDKDYLYYLLSSDGLQNKFKSLSAGSGVQNLKKETVSAIKIKLPPLTKQKIIANILIASDDEIVALEKKLFLLKEQRRYLLNNLVTGKIRTPENLLSRGINKFEFPHRLDSARTKG